MLHLTINVVVVLACLFMYGDAAITGWTTPSISGQADGAGTLSITENQAVSTTIETYVATTDASSVTYSLDTAVSPFAVASGGELTITAALDFETTTSYTLKIKAVDDASPTPGSGTATITVTVTNVNEAPVFSGTYSPCIADGSTADTTLTTVSATDVDASTTLTFALGTGNTGTAFKIDSSSGLIQVDAGVTLDKATTATYDLAVEVHDSALTATTTVSVTVQDTCAGSSGVTFSVLLLLFTFFITKV